MGRMNVRATYALDQATAQRIRQLARLWQVSQAEVIRRSVELAAASAADDALTPADVVAHYLDHPPTRTRAQTLNLIDASRRLRLEDDSGRGGSS
jgi:hypothetical protein